MGLDVVTSYECRPFLLTPSQTSDMADSSAEAVPSKLQQNFSFHHSSWWKKSDFVTVIFLNFSASRYLFTSILCCNLHRNLSFVSKPFQRRMQSVVKAASLGQLSRATSSTVPNLAGAVAQGAPAAAAAGIQLDIPKVPLTSYSMSKELLKGSQMRITSGLGGKSTEFLTLIDLNHFLQPLILIKLWMGNTHAFKKLNLCLQKLYQW